MTWINGGTTHAATLGELPDMARKFADLYASLWRQPHIPGGTLELCRLRLAQLFASEVEWLREDFPVEPAKRDSLAHWHQNPGFSSAERACLAFTEVYAMDTGALTDEQAAAVTALHGDAGLVTLIEALGLFDGMTRLSLLWQLPPPTTR
jgi:alkylhydroperoxidase family enzyme